jgi:hypothetical protein
MKAILTRIRRMEQNQLPDEDRRSQLVADLLRERRRRRCEANGEPFEELPQHSTGLAPGRRLSVAETLRMARTRAYERSRIGECPGPK